MNANYKNRLRVRLRLARQARKKGLSGPNIETPERVWKLIHQHAALFPEMWASTLHQAPREC